MAHTARAGNLEDEEIIDEDGIANRGEGGALIGIKRVIGSPADETDSEVEITEVRTLSGGKRRRGTGEKVTWSDDDDNGYEKFKNRKSDKRKKVAAKKKSLNAKLKETIASRKRARKHGDSPERKERMWEDQQEDEMFEDEDIPDYLKDRRREFDRKYQALNEAGLHLPPCYDTIEFSDDERLEDLLERPDFPRTVDPSREYEDIYLPHSGGTIPASIAQYLRDYQVDGVAFLHDCFVFQKGGILGDDMGLGKTVQVAAFLIAAFGKSGDERDWKRMRKMRKAEGTPWYPKVMIICPSTLMDNWRNELTRWGWWHIEKFHGSNKSDILQMARAGRLEVLITTYTTYKNHKSELNLVEWDCVVADECHHIKERKSQTTQAMNEVNSLCRIGLTGTAIQNNYEELWTLLNWANPGRYGPISTWISSISEPLRIGQSHDATFHQLKVARDTATALVQNLMPQFFLRRMKSLIAHQLPKKSDRVVFCHLTEIQKDAYTRFLESDIVETVRNATELCPCESGKKSGWCCSETLPGTSTSWKAVVFPVITTLTKLSSHLALLIPDSNAHSDKQQRDLEFLQRMVPDRWRELYENRDSLFNLSNPDFCGKWKVLKKLLKHWHENGDKVLIFSHSVKLLRTLQFLFKNTSYNVSFLSGETPPGERQTVVDDFNSDPGQFVFLISTKAGGVGLNITSANKVVIFDPNWNPSYDLQAQDRAYRIGQQRDVEVFRLICAGTIEEIVYARQIYKQQQANIGYNASTERRYFKGVQKNPFQKGEIFGLDNLLTFHEDNFVLRDIINKTNVAEAKLGIDMVEVDMDDFLNDEDDPLRVDDDKEDSAMSQLAALLTNEADFKQPKVWPKTDIVQAILASAGIQYTHENSEVIGSSKVEAQLSRRAAETGNDTEIGEARLFAENASTTELGRILYQFQPPEDVRERQFCTMARTFGFANATEFALVVEGWTQNQRRCCLERFYSIRKERVTELETEKIHSDDQVSTVDTADIETEDDEL